MCVCARAHVRPRARARARARARPRSRVRVRVPGNPWKIINFDIGSKIYRILRISQDFEDNGPGGLCKHSVNELRVIFSMCRKMHGNPQENHRCRGSVGLADSRLRFGV